MSFISNSSDDNTFRQIVFQVVSLFRKDRRLLETKGSLIVKNLCFSLKPERVFRCFAEVLEKDTEDLEFCSLMVQNLNTILVNASELSGLRKRLKRLDLNVGLFYFKDGAELFSTLYKAWCHNQVAVFTLCILSQSYEHAFNIINVIGCEFDITVGVLVQFDKLVQLIESPVFTYLRLQLLDPTKYPYLLNALYGILMILPQSSAFSTLRIRLNCVSNSINNLGNSTEDKVKRYS